jgi:hypothetical protein
MWKQHTRRCGLPITLRFSELEALEVNAEMDGLAEYPTETPQPF